MHIHVSTYVLQMDGPTDRQTYRQVEPGMQTDRETDGRKEQKGKAHTHGGPFFLQFQPA